MIFVSPSQPLSPDLLEPRDDTVVVWLGMAGVLINARGTLLLIDPLMTAIHTDDGVQSETGHRFLIDLPIEAKNFPHADAVLYTHQDRDHFGLLTARTFLLQKNTPVYTTPPTLERLAEIGIDAKQPRFADKLTFVRDFETYTIGATEVHITPARHNMRPAGRWQRGDACGFLVKTPDGVIWHPGDSWLIDELLEYKGVDVMFFDVAKIDSHLGPEGSASLGVSCGAKILFAYHYGMFDMPAGTYGGCDPHDALPYVESLNAKFLIQAPGKPLFLPQCLADC